MNAAAGVKPHPHRRTVAMDGLSRPVRVLVWVGYVAVAALLATTFASKALSSVWSSVEVASSSGPVRIPSTIALAAGLAQVFGWAFLLTGASYFWKRLFVPILLLFLIFSLMQGSADRWLLLLPIAAFVLWLHFGRGHVSWRRLPLIEFACWSAAGAILWTPLWFGAGDQPSVQGLETAFELIVLLAMPFWFLLGAELCELAVTAGRSLVGSVRRRFAARLRLVTVAILIVPPLLSVALFRTDRWTMMFADVFFGFALLAVAGVILLVRRWTATTAIILQIVSVALLVLAWALSVGLGGERAEPKDPLEWMLSWTPLPTIFLFVLAAAFNLMSFGARYCNGDSVSMPRRGRVLAYFGFAILVCGALLLLANARDETGNPPDVVKALTTNVAGLGILFVGFPYLGWLLLRRREALVGAQT